MHFNNFAEEGVFLKRELDQKGVVSFWRGKWGFLGTAIIIFTSWLLFDLLFMCRLTYFLLGDYRLLIFTNVLAYFVLLKVFLSFVLLIAYLRGEVYRSYYKWELEYLISYFYFSFKLSERRKVFLKEYGMEKGVRRKFVLGGWLIFNRALESFQKKEAW